MSTAINQARTMYYIKNSNSFNDKSYQKNSNSSPYDYANMAHQEREENHAKKVSKMKRMINGTLKEDRGYSDSILDSIKSYGESIKASRTASQKTNQSVKKLRYNFKKISSQLMRCKTSGSARLVAGKARREVVKLKQDLVSGLYNEDDVQIAINHAEAIERAAKKKVRHLQEEEMIKIKDETNGDNPCDDIEAKVEEETDAIYEKEQEIIDEITEELREEFAEEMKELTEEEMAELLDAMDEMMKESVGDIFDDLLIVPDQEMEIEEFKSYKLKHRQSEEKAIIEADLKYLKDTFDGLSKEGENIDFSSNNVDISL